MKQTHKQKVRLARKLLSNKECRANCPIFLSENWNDRQWGKSEKQKKQGKKREKSKH
jgi:hypothetical protein